MHKIDLPRETGSRVSVDAMGGDHSGHSSKDTSGRTKYGVTRPQEPKREARSALETRAKQALGQAESEEALEG